VDYDFTSKIRELEAFAKARMAEKHALMRERADAIDADKRRTEQQLARYGVPMVNPDVL